MMIEPGLKVYGGMIIGEHRRDKDLEVNVSRPRSSPTSAPLQDVAVRLTPPTGMRVEKALAYIEDDELVEVTPKTIRLRKGCSTPPSAGARSAPRRPKERRRAVQGGKGGP